MVKRAILIMAIIAFVLLAGALILKYSEKNIAINNLIQGEGMLILAIITAFYAWQTNRIVNEDIRTRELDFLERGLILLYEPLHSSLISLYDHLEKLLSGNDDLENHKKEIRNLLNVIQATLDKYGHMISESILEPFEDDIRDCQKILDGEKKADFDTIRKMIRHHARILFQIFDIRDYVRKSYSAGWLENKKRE